MSKLVNDDGSKVYVLTSSHEGKHAGFVLSWAVKASLSRKTPRIILVISKFNHSLITLEKTRRFCLNLLAAHQTAEFMNFGSSSGRDTDKFSSVSFESTPYGPALSGAAGFALGEIDEIFETPDRKILYCSVVEEVVSPRKPMILREILDNLSVEEQQKLNLKMDRDTERDEKQFTGE